MKSSTLLSATAVILTALCSATPSHCSENNSSATTSTATLPFNADDFDNRLATLEADRVEAAFNRAYNDISAEYQRTFKETADKNADGDVGSNNPSLSKLIKKMALSHERAAKDHEAALNACDKALADVSKYQASKLKLFNIRQDSKAAAWKAKLESFKPQHQKLIEAHKQEAKRLNNIKGELAEETLNWTPPAL